MHKHQHSSVNSKIIVVIKNLLFASVVVDGNGAKVAIFNSSATEGREVDGSVGPSEV